MNEAVATMGMAIFFILSGFLITRFLHETPFLRVFLIRRAARILPLSWIVLTVLLVCNVASPGVWAANYLFVANIPPYGLVMGGGHLWSLCVEVQFYICAALAVAIWGRKCMRFVPAVAVAVTCLRVACDTQISIITWFRVDEILAGGTLALIFAGRLGDRPLILLRKLNFAVFAVLLLASSHPWFGPLMFLRPYMAMVLVGTTLVAPSPLLHRTFSHRIITYLATISYAVYVIHGVLAVTWLGTGASSAIKYAKRPLLFAVTFALSHLSTFFLELPITSAAKRFAKIPNNQGKV